MERTSTSGTHLKAVNLDDLKKASEDMKKQKEDHDLRLVRACMKAGIAILPDGGMGLKQWTMMVPKKIYDRLVHENINSKEENE